MGQAAARLGDTCAGHCFNPRGNTESSPNVFLNGLGAHRVGDGWPTHSCPPNSHSSVTSEGSSTVFVNGKALARIGDALDCGDIISQGSPNIFVGG